MPKLVLIGSLWLLVVSLSCWQELQQLRDPTYDYQFDTGYATVFSYYIVFMNANMHSHMYRFSAIFAGQT